MTAKDYVAALLSLIAVIATLVWNRQVQIKETKRQLAQAETTARAAAYALIRQLYRSTDDHRRFTYGPGGMIWLNVHQSVFPDGGSLVRIEPLTAREVSAVTALLYAYKESIGFMRAAASKLEVMTRPDEPRPKPYLALDMDVLELVYKYENVIDEGTLEEVRKRLNVILDKCRDALEEMQMAAETLFPGSSLAKLMAADNSRDAAWRSNNPDPA